MQWREDAFMSLGGVMRARGVRAIMQQQRAPRRFSGGRAAVGAAASARRSGAAAHHRHVHKQAPHPTHVQAGWVWQLRACVAPGQPATRGVLGSRRRVVQQAGWGRAARCDGHCPLQRGEEAIDDKVLRCAPLMARRRRRTF